MKFSNDVEKYEVTKIGQNSPLFLHCTHTHTHTHTRTCSDDLEVQIVFEIGFSTRVLSVTSEVASFPDHFCGLIPRPACNQAESIMLVGFASMHTTKTWKNFRPGISATEQLIDLSNLSSYVPSASSEGYPRMQAILDTTGIKKLKLEKALHFEPYHGIQVRCIV